MSNRNSRLTIPEIGSFQHPVESEMLCSLTQPTKVPYFNAPIYLQNKTQIGKIDEILGPINEVYFTVKMEQGMLASSFKKDDKVYIGGDKLLPIERFLPKPKVPGGEAKSESSSIYWERGWRERGWSCREARFSSLARYIWYGEVLTGYD
jgi:H/ACA ribonucleoprotein complex subunit 1